MFIPDMVTDSTITDSIFSWYMSGESGSTYIDFGTPNSAIYDASKLIYISIENNTYWWTNQVRGMRWTTNSTDNTEYKFDAV